MSNQLTFSVVLATVVWLAWKRFCSFRGDFTGEAIDLERRAILQQNRNFSRSQHINTNLFVANNHVILFCVYGQAATLACYIEFLPFTTAVLIHEEYSKLLLNYLFVYSIYVILATEK